MKSRFGYSVGEVKNRLEIVLARNLRQKRTDPFLVEG